MPRQSMKFYCFRTKKGFTTKEWGVFTKNNRYFAVTEQDGNKCVRIISKAMYEQHKR